MSTCPDPEFCSAYIDGEINADLKEKFESHLLKCKKCRTLISKYALIKRVLTCKEIPELDLNKSFEKLKGKSSAKQLNISYNYLLLKKWSKITASAVASVFVLIFGFYFINNIGVPKQEVEYTLYKEENDQFIPIVPTPYKPYSAVNFLDVEIENMDLFIGLNKKIKNNGIKYKNFVYTFNGFSNLYSQLEENNLSTINIQPINNDNSYYYASSMPIYVNLNKNGK